MPGIGALFVSTAVVGMCFTVFQLATQQATGALGGTADRARNFSVLSMGYSISGLIGPLIAGVAIDHWGFRVTFAVLAVLPVLSIVVLASKHIYVPVPEPVPHASTPGGIAALLKQPILRRVLITNVFIAMGWDLHMIFVPIYGAKIGLSASEIGAVLATFAAATFVIRLLMPALLRRRTEQQLMTVSLCSAGAVYAAYSFATSPWILAALSFTLGLMLGSGQPVVMSLLHAHAPPGRIGEAVGVRMSLVQGVAVAAPLLFGALGTSLGLTPVFWMVGVCLAASGVVAGRR
jgi:MFS family permease